MQTFLNIKLQIWPSIKDWLIDNLRSNFISIFIGILISLFIGLFTTPEKNNFICWAILFFLLSFVSLIFLSFYRTKMDETKEYIFSISMNNSNEEKWDKVHKDSDFKKYFSHFFGSLIFFMIFLIGGAILTDFGNRKITRDNNIEFERLTNKVDSLTILNKDIENQLKRNAELEFQLIDSLYLRIVERIDSLAATHKGGS